MSFIPDILLFSVELTVSCSQVFPLGSAVKLVLQVNVEVAFSGHSATQTVLFAATDPSVSIKYKYGVASKHCSPKIHQEIPLYTSLPELEVIFCWGFWS